MAYILRHEEDWSSYGTDINAVSNNTGPDYGAYTYPDGIGANLSGHGTTVGPTLGPNSGPGCQDLTTSGTFVTKQGLYMSCRDFKIEALYDFTGWSPSVGNLTQSIMSGYYDVGNFLEFSDFLFLLQHNVAGHLIVSGGPDPPSGPDYFNSGTLTSVVPTTGNVQFRVEGRVSTFTGGPGTYDVNADGYLKVYINNSLIYDTGAIRYWWKAGNVSGTIIKPEPYWNTSELGLHGHVGLWRIYASDDCVSGSSRNLLTGQGHSVEGNDNVIAGRQGTVSASDMVALFSLDDAAHVVSTSKTFEVHADFINLNGTTTVGGGSPVTDINAALDALGT
jgi:hypothetical protein